MHTTHIGKVAFVHNGDHSGDVHIVLPDIDPLRLREIVVPMAALAISSAGPFGIRSSPNWNS